MKHVYVILVLVVTVAGGCDFKNMRPGTACGSCHNGDKAPTFGAAGTVYSTPTDSTGDGLEGVTIEVVDAEGNRASMQSSESGNFFTKKRLTPPLQVTISNGVNSISMSDAPSGDCNSCHTMKSAPNPGRIYVPLTITR